MKKVLFGNTNKVLFISYAFPPKTGGGIFRLVKFLKYLPEFGIEASVLTVKDRYYADRDETLLEELPKNLSITRIDYNEPGLWFGKPDNWFKNRFWQSFLFYGWYPWFSIADRRLVWKNAGIKAALDIIKKEKIETVFTSFSSAADLLIGLELKKQTGVNWVVDFRDEWASSNYLTIPTPLHRAKIKALEKKVVMAADAVTTVSPPLTDYFAKISGNPKKCVTITNGYDAEDFAHQIDFPKRNYMQILYAGSLYGSRSAETFNLAIAELNLPNLKVEFVGGKNKVAHPEAVKLERQADVLLLLLSPDDRPAVYTGKIFEYLAARRPILCLAPVKTAAAKLINDLKVGVVVEPLDKEGIKIAIKKMYESWQKGELSIPQVDIKPYDRKALAEHLASIIKSLPAKKLKIMIVANTRSPQSAKLVEYLLNRDYEIHFVTLDGSTIEGAINYHIYQKKLVNRFYPWYLLMGFSQKYMALKELEKLIADIKPDVVHGHGINFAGILAVFSGFESVVVTTRGSDLMQIEKQPKFEQFLIKHAIQNASIVTGNSLALKEKAIKLGIEAKKWREVYFGINLDIFKPKDVSSLKKELGLTSEKIIFSARSLKPIYNIDILVQAVAKLEETPRHGSGQANWKMIMLRQNEDLVYSKYIKKLVQELKLESKVIYLEKVDVERMAELYSLADVVVSIAQSDGAAATFLEAMACEAKIVISEVGFVKEWADGKFWTVPVGDIEKTTQAIETALQISKPDFKISGEKNREIIAERAEINDSFKKFEEIYQDVTNK